MSGYLPNFERRRFLRGFSAAMVAGMLAKRSLAAYDGFANGSPGVFFSEASAPVTAAPLTMACWFRTTSSTLGQTAFSIQRAADSDYFGISVDGDIGGDPVSAYVNGANAGTARAVTTSGYSVNTWHHLCGVFTSATNRAAFLDGGNKGTDATSRTPTGLSKMNIGVYKSGGDAFGNLAGRVAEVALWNVALTDAEVASLGKGMSPFKVRPQSLVRYWPLIRNTGCVKSGVALTASGSPSVANHTRIYGL